MSHAAVPDYLARRLERADCPPGHRFNLYFPIWRDDWSADKAGKATAIRACIALPDEAKRLLKALIERQRALAQVTGALLLEAKSLSPFATGLGLEHPVENGFAFLSPYGLPYLAGSGVKGVFRATAQELSGENDPPLTSADIDAMFGKEPPPGSQDAERGALTFWDVFPDCARMSVEIMTPHHGDYYYQKKGSGTPHDAGQPNPIPFLAVPPGAGFRFVVQCDERRLPESLACRWREIVAAIFTHACDWRGFGAKTAVGYGALSFDADAQRRAESEQTAARAEAQAADARQAALAAMSPNLRRIEEFKAAFAARAEQLRGNKEKLNADYHGRARKLAQDALEGSDWTAEERRSVADAITEWLPRIVEKIDKEQLKKLKISQLRGQ